MSNPASNLVATRAAYPSMLRSPVASMRSPPTASSLGTRRTLQINSKGEVQAVPTSRAREYPLDRGVLRAPQAANRRSNDHRSVAEEILRRGQRGKSVPIDPAKITVEPRVSYLPSPIKLDGHAAGVVANTMNGNCSARRTSYEANSARLAVGP